MTEETLQERYIRELLDPRTAMTPREVAAREEILLLRRLLDVKLPTKKAEKDSGKGEVKRG
jgi:hypothetical protein